MKKISKLLILALAVAGLVTPAVSVYAKDAFCDESLKGTALWESMGCDQTQSGANEVFSNTVIGIINGVLGIIGLVAVIFIIYGGFLYLTSAGDASKVKKGRDSILYAVIGLIIVGIAFAVVNFVIVNILGQGSN